MNLLQMNLTQFITLIRLGCLKVVFFWGEGQFNPPPQKKGVFCHHRIQYVQISLSTPFHLKQKILIFWTKFAKKM